PARSRSTPAHRATPRTPSPGCRQPASEPRPPAPVPRSACSCTHHAVPTVRSRPKRRPPSVERMTHLTIEPSILYVGTPVALLSTANDDGTINLAPMSSAWALGDVVVLGVGEAGQ